MYVYIYIYIQTYIYIYIHAYIACVYKYVHVYIYTYMELLMYAWYMYISLRMHVCMHIYIYIYIYIGVCVCAFVDGFCFLYPGYSSAYIHVTQKIDKQWCPRSVPQKMFPGTWLPLWRDAYFRAHVSWFSHPDCRKPDPSQIPTQCRHCLRGERTAPSSCKYLSLNRVSWLGSPGLRVIAMVILLVEMGRSGGRTTTQSVEPSACVHHHCWRM